MISDLSLSTSDVQQLGTADAIAAFFARLGYQTNARTPQTPANLGITAEGTARPIRRIELIADHEGLQVYLFEVSSVTLSHTRALARTFRNRAGNYLLILTSDYEQLDFTLLERYLSPKSHDALGIGTPQAGIRPRVLTIERRNPSRVDLRVLRRFVFVASDGYGQYERLSAAYDIADWSENFFNNRALFSDYYLAERLRDNPAWAEDPKPAFLRLRETLRAASSASGQPDGPLRRQIVEPTLEILGFRLHKGKRAGSGVIEPDYLLSASTEPDKTLAACLAYPWGRSLDGKDEQRDRETPEENPTAIVVSLLENGKVPWVIVTNGKQWRLHAAKAHSRATNYYEVDLEEALAESAADGSDPAEAFRYFWFFFRRQAFEPTPVVRGGATHTLSFLDLVLADSEDYAKELGERLKNRVFIQTFPYIAEGFITFIRQRDGLHADFPQDRFNEIYQGTLTLLYRLLFVLYAEARDLLPVKELRGYWEASLAKLKREIAEAAGPIVDEAEGRLRLKYRHDEFVLYDRLLRLFEIIDQGDPGLNVPTYNGGLFISRPDAGDDSPEGTNARFLSAHKVPDYDLARALDLLARDEDSKSHDLVVVDYKSLGVRHLGSIYEGLLEFKVRIADRRLAVVKEKAREVYVPAADLSQQQRERAERQGRIVRKGRVYLENDRRERKASGSYYTPDYIVNYIVQQSVGPVLQQKFEAVRPKLRDAQRRRKEFFKRQDALRKAGIRPEPQEKADLVGQELVPELFNVRVLDPAMGSGHFLVEVVDFITDKTLDFLNAFPWNPVFADLARTRMTILKEAGERGIAIDERRLTDVSLLKRHILKRCIYGVDLNPMAVELAKVSLWLDCFTLGAPLSFLDHHLRCGNSLIGVTVAEVDGIRTREGQLPLSESSEWIGLQQAIQGMILVGGLPDATASQVGASREEYRRALNLLAPFKKILDIHAARWFQGEPLPQRRKVSRLDIRDEVLKSGDLFNWAVGGEGYMFATERYREVLRTSEEASRRQSFFHWELEFPEVFYGPRKGTMQVIDRLQGGGFNAVIGNPPYLGVRTGAHQSDFANWAVSRYNTARGNWDIFALFIELGVAALSTHGNIGMIVPERLGTNRDFLPVRELLYQGGGPLQFLRCGRAFEDPTVHASVLIHNPCLSSRSIFLADFLPDGISNVRKISLEILACLPDKTFGLSLHAEDVPLLVTLSNAPGRLGDVLEITRGMECGKNDPHVQQVPTPGTVPVISGEGVRAFVVVEQGLYVPLGLAPVAKYKDPALFLGVPKILIRFVAPHPIAAVDSVGIANFNTVYNGHLKTDYEVISPHAIVAILNSSVVRWWFTRAFSSEEALYPHIQKYQLEAIPFPSDAKGSPEMAQLAALAEKIPASSSASETESLRASLDELALRLYGLEPAESPGFAHRPHGLQEGT